MKRKQNLQSLPIFQFANHLLSKETVQIGKETEMYYRITQSDAITPQTEPRTQDSQTENDIYLIKHVQ